MHPSERCNPNQSSSSAHKSEAHPRASKRKTHEPAEMSTAKSSPLPRTEMDALLLGRLDVSNMKPACNYRPYALARHQANMRCVVRGLIMQLCCARSTLFVCFIQGSPSCFSLLLARARVHYSARWTCPSRCTRVHHYLPPYFRFITGPRTHPTRYCLFVVSVLAVCPSLLLCLAPSAHAVETRLHLHYGLSPREL